MELLFKISIPIAIVLIFYIVIQVAIDKSLNTQLLKENNKILAEIKELLKNQNKNITKQG